MEVETVEEQERDGIQPVAEGDEFEEYDGPEGVRDDEDEGDEDGGAQPRKTLADLAAEQPDADESPEDDEPEPQQRLFGTESKVTGSVKGRRPDQSAVRLKSGAVVVTGQFHPDDVLELRVLARLDKVEFVYTRDKDGAVKAVKRVHHATPTSIEQVEVPAEIRKARIEHAADALDVSPEDLAAALENAAAQVGAE